MIPYHWQYLPLLMQIVVVFALASGMVVASWFVGRHRNTAVKLAAYECGIEAVGDARARFSVRFYMVAMLFILFDVEAVFMMPWAVIYRDLPRITGQRLFGFWEMVVYLGFVSVGLYYIVRKGILNWSQDKADL
ncbi:MAG TPA: NADH-quinone oxidoreductase subunit A [Terracidiphilus sp.]|nr:NADH-quinone oxidoreductase subunit A [Terracidiphilus sp.]